MRQALWLVKNGVALDVAMALDPNEAMAWGVVFGEFEGGAFDWDRLEWKPRD